MKTSRKVIPFKLHANIILHSIYNERKNNQLNEGKIDLSNLPNGINGGIFLH
jgi:hypothetical protein